MACVFFAQNGFAVTSLEKSSTKEPEKKETKVEEEMDTEVLEVFQPTHEWQALRPGNRFSPVPLKHTLNSDFICPLKEQPFSGLLARNSVVHHNGSCCFCCRAWGTFIF